MRGEGLEGFQHLANAAYMSIDVTGSVARCKRRGGAAGTSRMPPMSIDVTGCQCRLVPSPPVVVSRCPRCVVTSFPNAFDVGTHRYTMGGIASFGDAWVLVFLTLSAGHLGET
jgi:hypothetical protein